MFATILTVTLAAAPASLGAPDTPDPPQGSVAAQDFSPERINSTMVGEAFELQALDAAGNVIGTMAVWRDGQFVHVAADYDDGWSEATIDATDPASPELLSWDHNLPGAVLEYRANVVLGLVSSGGEQGDAVPGWLKCSGFVAMSAAAAASGQLVSTAVLGTFAYCHCAALTDKLPDCT